MAFAIGQNIGPYRIVEQLGQGGMATVYKAYHASLDRYVAVKVLHEAFLEDSNFLARFQREARLVARLEHPNIVPIYDYAEADGRPYLVMKYIEGETLKAHLNRGKLSPQQVSEIISKVGAGLSYAHSQGVLHRDIKPSNVILANDGGIYLADFGLARIAQSGDSTLTSDMILGTPQYISPEQALGKSDLNQGTDVYSFGVMVYEMTTGRVPFSADTPFSIIHDHIYSPLPLPTQVNSSLSMDVERVLLKSLAKERADRYPEVSIFVHEFLEAWQENFAATVVQASHQPLSGSPDPVAENPAESPAESQDEVSSMSDSSSSLNPKKRRPAWLIGLLVGLPIVICICCLLIGVLNENSNEKRDSALPEDAGQQVIPNPGEEQDFENVKPVDLDALPVEQAVEIVESEPESPVAHVILGLALIKSGNEIDGHSEIQIASELAHSDIPLLLGLAQGLEKRDVWNGALMMYMRAYESRPNLPMLKANLRRAAYYAVENPIAPEVTPLDVLERADRLTSMVSHARYLTLHHQDFEKANSILDEIMTIDPKFPEAFLLKAEIALIQNDPARAKAILTDLLARKDIFPWVRQQGEHFLSSID
jgi:serine/threonine protein kinase